VAGVWSGEELEKEVYRGAVGFGDRRCRKSEIFCEEGESSGEQGREGAPRLLKRLEAVEKEATID